MSIVSGLQQAFYNMALKKFQRNAEPKRKMNLGISKDIAVLMDVSEGLDTPVNKAAQNLINQLKGLKKTVRVLAYSSDNKNPEFSDFICFCKKDTNWALVPKGNSISEFLSGKYDILFAYYLNDSKPLDFILNATSAQLKAGYYQVEKSETLDVMVHNPKNSFEKGNEQLLELLTKLNS
jgi:hypothetical protein